MEVIYRKTGRFYQESMRVMRTFSIKAILVATIIFTVAAEAMAQSYVPTPVTISNNKVKIDGKLCYSHIVLERQTIYSICKAYNVTAEDLYKFNPRLKEEGLKKNGIIIIPSQEALNDKKEEEKAKTETVAEVAAVTAPKEAHSTKPSGKLKKHTVKWYETIEDIAKKYGVTVEAIVKENNLEKAEVKARQKIFIPEADTSVPSPVVPKSQKDSTEAVATQTEAPSPIIERKDTTMVADSIPTGDSLVAEPIVMPKDHIDIALVLPLAATGTTSKRNYMDFYSGVLFGLHKCANEGLATNLRVFDIDNGGMLDEGFFNGCDLAIGPVYQETLGNVLEIISDSIMVVSPLDHKAIALAEENKNFIQAPTHRTRQYADLVEWVQSEVSDNDKVIYISETNTRDTVAVREMKEALNASGLKYESFSYTILQGRGIGKSLAALVTNDGKNHFIIESESEAWVNDLVRNLNILQKKTEIYLYSPSKIRSFESIDAESLYNTSLHVSMSYNIDYDNPKVKDFLLKYRAIFHTEPSLFAYQGYDIITYFSQLISTYGHEWKEHLTDTAMQGLQTSFQFEKTPEGGYINNGIRRVQYYPGGESEIKE